MKTICYERCCCRWRCRCGCRCRCVHPWSWITPSGIALTDQAQNAWYKQGSVLIQDRLLCAFALAGILSGCDLRPAPKQEATPNPATTIGSAPSPARDASLPSDGGNASAGCLNVANHLAQLLVDHAKDPAVRSTYEQGRTNMVRVMAQACTDRRWSAEVQQCYLASRTEAQARACENAVAAPAAGSAQPKAD